MGFKQTQHFAKYLQNNKTFFQRASTKPANHKPICFGKKSMFAKILLRSTVLPAFVCCHLPAQLAIPQATIRTSTVVITANSKPQAA
jgi:hypothetical protein